MPARVLPYAEFRTGLSFAAVVAELQAEASAAYDAGVYFFWSRSTVLGRWREHKLAMYEHYLGTADRGPLAE